MVSLMKVQKLTLGIFDNSIQMAYIIQLNIHFCNICSFMISPCVSEFDISIIDRLSPIFNGSPFIVRKISDERIGQKNSAKNGFGFTLESQEIDVRLRYNLNEFILFY